MKSVSYTHLDVYKRQALKAAKASHDALEAVYNPYVDFEGVRAQAALEAGRLLSWLEQ